MRLAAAAAIVCSCVSLSAACNKRVFVEVQQSCDSTIPVDVSIPTSKAADILIVVDNSGSMQEEQDRLAENFINLDGGCPLGDDLTNIPEEYRNPAPALYEPGGDLAECGFIQLLAAFDNDFRVGVITTDVGLYDNRVSQAQTCVGGGGDDGVLDGRCIATGAACNNADAPCDDAWGSHPQRGCLQPDGDPSTPGVRKLIAREDLRDADVANDKLADRFQNTLANIRTFGSPWERGLDAAQIFLDKDAVRAPGCEDDLTRFRRPDAQLVVIFLTDEEDCSHGLDPDAPFDELAGEPAAPGRFDDLFGRLLPNNTILDPSACYAREGELPPVSLYADAIKAVDPRAKIAVIAGLLPDDGADGGFEAGSCLAGSPPSSGCYASEGNSNNPSADQCPGGFHDGERCCVADAGNRYVDFARAFESKNGRDFLLDSICDDAFRRTMIQVAAFIASNHFVDLVEPPQDGIVVVTEVKAGVERTIERIAPEACDSTSGWYLEGDARVVFCEDAIPGPGDDVHIRAKGQADTETCRQQSGG